MILLHWGNLSSGQSRTPTSKSAGLTQLRALCSSPAGGSQSQPPAETGPGRQPSTLRGLAWGKVSWPRTGILYPSPASRSAFWASHLSCHYCPGPELLRLGVWGPIPASSRSHRWLLTVGTVARAGSRGEGWRCSELPGRADCVVGCRSTGLVSVGVGVGNHQGTQGSPPHL